MRYLDNLIEKVEAIKPTYRIVIFAGTVLLIFAIFYFLSFSPKAKRIDQLKNEISNLEMRIKKAKALARRLPEFKKKAEKMEKQFRVALELLPNQREIPSLLERINHIGIETDLVFQVFRPGREKSEGFYSQIPIYVELEGKFHNIMEFMYKVTTMKRIVNVFDIRMNPKEKFSTQLRTTIKAATYRFVPDVEKRKK